MAIKVFDKEIKDTVARIVATLYSYSTKTPYKDAYRHIRYNLKTDKGFKSMVAMGKKYGDKIKHKDAEVMLMQLKICENLYFADKKRG